MNLVTYKQTLGIQFEPYVNQEKRICNFIATLLKAEASFEPGDSSTLIFTVDQKKLEGIWLLVYSRGLFDEIDIMEVKGSVVKVRCWQD